MTEIKCIKCINVSEPLIEKKGLGKNNVDYIDGMECKLKHEIRMGGTPGFGCEGKYFKPK